MGSFFLENNLSCDKRITKSFPSSYRLHGNDGSVASDASPVFGEGEAMAIEIRLIPHSAAVRILGKI